MRPYSFFEDKIVAGDFKSLRQEHHFKPVANGTIIIDMMYYEPPHSTIGKLFDLVFSQTLHEEIIRTKK